MNPNSNFLARNAAQAMQARALGHVPPAASVASPPPNIGERQQNFFPCTVPGTLAIPGGGSFTVPAQGDFVYVVSAQRTTAGTQLYDGEITLKDSNGNRYAVFGPDTYYEAPRPFRSIQITNTGVYEAQVIIVSGFGKMRVDSAFTPTGPEVGTVNGSITRPNNVTPYGAGQVVSSTLAAYFELTNNTAVGVNQPYVLVGATLRKSGQTILNADFSFYLGSTNAQIDQAVAAPNDAQVILDFSASVALGAGLGTRSILSDFRQTIFAQGNPAITPFGFTGTLIANAAYVPDANEVFRIDLIFENARSMSSALTATVSVN